MNMRKEYFVAMASSPAELRDIVEERLADGWDLHGGVSVAMVMGDPSPDGDDVGFMFAQALGRIV